MMLIISSIGTMLNLIYFTTFGKNNLIVSGGGLTPPLYYQYVLTNYLR